jgi:hypothetical protein
VSLDLLTPDLIAQRITASGNFSAAALNCGNEKRPAKAVPIVKGPLPDDAGCVRFGSELDVAAAVLVWHDYIEWCANGTTVGPTCQLNQAVGTLESVPESVKDCIGDIEPNQKHGSGFSLGSSVRRAGRLLELVYLKDRKEKLQGYFCEPGEVDVFRFQLDARQLYAMIDPEESAEVIKAASVVRIVTRSIAPN